jgi:hypothetical protein
MSFRTELADIFNVLATPSEVFEEIKIRPRWRAPVLVTSISGVAIGWFMIPAIQQPLQSIYERSFGEDGAGVAMSSMIKAYFVSEVIVRTAAIFVRWLLFSFILYGMVRLSVKKSSLYLKQVFSLVAYSEIIFVTMSILTVLIIYVIGLDNIETPSDTVIFKGLDLFLDRGGKNVELATFLANVNVFSLWYILIIAFGINMFTGQNKIRSVAISGIAWLCWSVISVLEPLITESIMNAML